MVRNDAEKIIIEYKNKGVNEDLALRTYTARLLGSEPEMVLHGGGAILLLRQQLKIYLEKKSLM